MPYTVALPDGRLVEFPDEVPPEKAAEILRRQFPAQGRPEGGFVPALKAGAASAQQGFANLGAELGLRDEAGAERTISDLERYKERTFKPSEEGWTEAPWTRFKETLGGSLPMVAAPLAAGVVGGLPAAGAVSALQFTGSNLERQREQGARVGNADLTSAAVTAIPQAALDMLSFKAIPGVRMLFGSLGKELTEEGAKAIAQQGMTKALGDYAARAGVAAGAEGATEVAQQFMERLQAGMKIGDPEARAEYVDALIGGAVLGGAMGVPGRAVERAKAKGVALGAPERERERQEQQAAQEAQRLQQMETDAQREQPTQAQPFFQEPQGTLPGVEAAPAAERPVPEQDPMAEASRYAEQKRQLEQLRIDHQQAESEAAGAGDIQKLKTLRQRRALLENEYEFVTKQLDALGGEPATGADTEARTRELAKAKADLQKLSGAGYDPAKADKLIEKIEALEKAVGPQQALDLGKPVRPQVREDQQSFNTRTYEPGGYQQPTQPQLAGAGEFLDQSQEVDKHRVEGNLQADIERMGQQARMPTGVQEQGALFGNELTSGIRQGTAAPANTQRSRASLLTDLAIARAARNKEAVSAAVEGLRDLAVREQQQADATQSDTTLQDNAGMRVPERERQVSQLRDRREAAFGFMVTTLEKFNKGLAKREEMDKARDAVIDTLAQEIGAARGIPVTDAERREVSTEASQLLRDLITRWGDTRDLINRGTKAEPEHFPAQLQATGEFNRAMGGVGTGPTGMGYANEESRAPGRQTLGNRFAAAETIREGLDEIRNRFAEGTGQQMAVDRTITPSTVTPQAFQQQVERLMPSLPAPAQKLAQRAQEAPIDEGLRQDISQALHRAATSGQWEPDEGIEQRLKTLEQGKRSETEQPTKMVAGDKTRPAGAANEVRSYSVQPDGDVRTAVQGELFPDTSSTAFATPEEFQQFLASDGLDALRRLKRLPGETASRVHERLRVLRDKVEGFQKLLERRQQQYENSTRTKQEVEGMLAQAEREHRARAERQLANARRLLGNALTKLDAELHQQQAAYIRASLRHSFTQRVVDELNQTIGKNKQAFAPIAKAWDAHQKEMDAARDAIRAELKALFPGGGDVETQRRKELLYGTARGRYGLDGGVVEQGGVRMERLTKLMEDHGKVLFKRGVLNKSMASVMTDERVVKFLDEDMRLQMELADELKTLAKTRVHLERATNALNAAHAAQQSDPAVRHQLAQRQALVNEALARLNAEAPDMQAARELLGEQDATLKAVEREIHALSDGIRWRRDLAQGIERSLRERADLRTKRPEQTQGQREAIDAERRRGEQAALEKREDDPNRTAVSFEPARRLEEARQRANLRIADLEEQAETAAEPEQRAQALAKLASERERIAKVTANAEKKLSQSIAKAARLETQIKAGEQRLEKARTDEAKANIGARLDKLRQDLKTTEARISVRRGNERTPVPTRAERAAEREEQNKALERTPGERLPARQLGPLTKKAVQAGNVRTGDASTADERRLSSQNPVRQDGKPRGPTGTQAMRQAGKDVKKMPASSALPEALLEQQRLETLLEKVDAALEKAQEAGDKEAIANRTEQKARVERAVARQQARVDALVGKKTVAPDEVDEMEAPAVRKPAMKTPAPRIEPPPEVAAALKRKPARKPEPAGDKTERYAQFIAKQRGVQFDTATPVHNMTFAQAARQGASATSSKLVKALFLRLADVFDAAPEGMKGRVYATTTAHNTGSLGTSMTFQNDEDFVFVISPEARPNANKVLLHELTHAATVRAMREHPELAMQVKDLRARVIDWINTRDGHDYVREHRMNLVTSKQSPHGIYGLFNEKEFVAELFANREFQKMLAAIPSDKPKKSVFTRFVEFLSKLWNLPEEAEQSVLAEAIALTDEIMEVTRKEIFGGKAPKATEPEASEANEYSADWQGVGDIAERVIARDKPFYKKVREAGAALTFETRLIDRFAPLERMSKKMDPLAGTQMMFFARMFDQRFHHVAQTVGEGVTQLVEKTRADGRKEFLLESKPGPNLRAVVQALQPAAKRIGGGDAASRVFTLYMSAHRARAKGINALNFEGAVTQADLDETLRKVDADPTIKAAFEKARTAYNAYNRSLMKLLADSGAISKDVAATLIKDDDYIPWYRAKNGNAVIQIGSETPITLGSIKQQPHLQELIGGSKPILDFMTSSVQNTNLIIDMALRNLATKSAVFELQEIDAAKILGGETAGPDIVQFKVNGEDRYARIDTDGMGIPATLLVEGMAGIPTQPTGILKALGVPARILRKAVTATPLYAARQLFRDSLAAPILTGADFTPVLGALRQIGQPNPLAERGVVGGQIFTGTQEDLSRILKRVTEGDKNWLNSLAKWEALTMQSDALTRRAQYNSYRAQGLSEMEATLMSLEAMNFTKRGSSPSIHMANAIIPFFNAQIQGLNVLWKSLTGKLPFNERLKIQEKLLVRGTLMAAMSMAYAAAMQDDEAYKNANPDQKYGNWFFRIPGVAEPIKIPVPFEVGYIFKALPEALYNTMVNDHGGEEAVKAFANIAKNTVPGGSSYLLPQAIKPAIEVGLGKSFYTGRDLLSAREQRLSPEAQYRPNTSEVAKLLGGITGISPIKLEHAVSGYTGTLGLALLQLVSAPLPTTDSPEKAAPMLHEGKLFGGAFQANDAGGIINSTYEQMLEYREVKTTVDELLRRGEKAKAMELMARKSEEYAKAQVTDRFTTHMAKLAKLEAAVRASNMTPAEKRERLDRIRQAKSQFAQLVRDADDRTTRQ